MLKQENRADARPWPSWILLPILMGLALALRWRYIQEIGLSVDEFTTIWAARQIWLRGLPLFPSGNLYPHGFVFTYLEAPAVLGAFHETVARIPGLFVSLIGLPVAYQVGRRLFDERVGLVVAAALAVDPDCILWGGRARMYGLLQLLTLLVVYVYYRGLADDRPRDRYLAMALLVAAIFTHLEAALLLPALGLTTLLFWPPRRLWRRSVILPFVLAATGAGVFFLLYKYGQPGHMEAFEQENRFYVALPTNPLGGLRAFAPFFTAPHRLPFTLLTIAGLYLLFRPRFDRRSPLSYLYVLLLAALTPLLLLAGPTWQNTRYLFLFLPLLLLGGGEASGRLLDRLPEEWPVRRWLPAGLAVVVALYVGLTGTRQAYRPELGYSQAFRYVGEQAAAEDYLLTLSPAACHLYLQKCDYFAIQRGYREFVVERPGDGVTADLWTATPALTRTAELVDLLASDRPVWFVVDTWRFQTRYDADFLQVVLEHMDLTYNQAGVLVFRGEGYGPLPQPAVWRERRAEFDAALALTGFGLSSDNPQPGEDLEITLNWQALEKPGVAYTPFLHLIQADGTGVAGVDEPLLRGLYQPDFWPKEMTFADRHRLTLPSHLPPGRYRLDLGLYPTGRPDNLLTVGGSDRLPLACLTVGEGTALPPPTTPTHITFGDRLRLVGYDLPSNLQPPTSNLQLHWQAIAPPDRDYTVFVHLIAPDGTIVAQDDAPPGDPFCPTSLWLPGEVVLDGHPLAIPADLPPGSYRLLVGLYHQPDNERLPAVDADGVLLGDSVVLTTLSIGPEPPR